MTLRRYIVTQTRSNVSLPVNGRLSKFRKRELPVYSAGYPDSLTAPEYPLADLNANTINEMPRVALKARFAVGNAQMQILRGASVRLTSCDGATHLRGLHNSPNRGLLRSRPL